MTIFVDPPIWPAHGTVFAHVVSDVSLDELHAFAERAGLRRGAFDEDHYDVPEHRYRDLVALGATPVSGRELARILAGCGLRVRSIERPSQVLGRLGRAWSRLLPAAEHADAADPHALGAELLQRWSEPHRHYHGTTHLAAVLNGISLLHRAGELPDGDHRTVRLAAWFHDAVHEGTPEDEEDSARLAEHRLEGLMPPEEIADVARLVRLTATHDADVGDTGAAVLVDADLEVLGRTPAAYRRYAGQVRREYPHVSDVAFQRGRADVLARLLARPQLFRTATGSGLWEKQARENLRAELDRLRAE